MDNTEVPSGPPGASYTVTVRVAAHPHPALLRSSGRWSARSAPSSLALDLVEVGAAGTTVDLTLQATSEEHVAAVTAALERADYQEDQYVSDRTFLYHLGGKIQVTPRVAIRTRQDLSLAYTPGVGLDRQRHRPLGPRMLGRLQPRAAQWRSPPTATPYLG